MTAFFDYRIDMGCPCSYCMLSSDLTLPLLVPKTDIYSRNASNPIGYSLPVSALHYFASHSNQDLLGADQILYHQGNGIIPVPIRACQSAIMFIGVCAPCIFAIVSTAVLVTASPPMMPPSPSKLHLRSFLSGIVCSLNFVF